MFRPYLELISLPKSVIWYIPRLGEFNKPDIFKSLNAQLILYGVTESYHLDVYLKEVSYSGNFASFRTS